MLTGVHILLTYRCTHECDHCFVHSSPRARGTFGRSGIREVLAQATQVGTVEWIYFEGGEPFLYYPLLLEGLAVAKASGFLTGVVTNAYFAESDEDALLWLEPLADLGVADLAISDDRFHHDGPGESPAARALAAAKRLRIPVGTISVQGESVRYRGRAADQLVEGLPLRPAEEFRECPDEDLADPGRVHIDAYGNVHLCQGVLMGNIKQTPLAALLAEWDPPADPISGPVLSGGPAALARVYGCGEERKYASACHLCYEVRKQLLNRYPGSLGPPSVYGQ